MKVPWFRFTAVPMLLTALVVGGLALVFEREATFVFDLRSLGALVYLAVFGSAVTFTIYYWMLANAPATRVALIAYTIPVVAVAVGAGPRSRSLRWACWWPSWPWSASSTSRPMRG